MEKTCYGVFSGSATDMGFRKLLMPAGKAAKAPGKFCEIINHKLMGLCILLL